MGWDEVGHEVEKEIRITIGAICGTIMILVAFLLRRHKWSK